MLEHKQPDPYSAVGILGLHLVEQIMSDADTAGHGDINVAIKFTLNLRRGSVESRLSGR